MIVVQIFASFILMVACITVSAPAFSFELKELQQKAEQCGRDYFTVYHAAPCEKLIDTEEYYPCKINHREFDGFGQAALVETRCIDEYAQGGPIQPWFRRVLECEARKVVSLYLKENPDDAVTKKISDIFSQITLQCDPLPTPEDLFKESQIPKYTLSKPDNVFSPKDGAEIVWFISKGIGYDTIHLGISLSDKSFWRYFYGLNLGVAPALPEEEAQLLDFMKLWKIYGIEAEDLSVTNMTGCCHFKTAKGGVARAFLYPNLLNPCSRKGPAGVSGHWMPTMSQIKKLEETLPNYLTLIGRDNLAVEIEQYDFLYLGIMVGQNAIIYVDAERKYPEHELAQDWPKIKVGRIAGLCDGGDAAWGVEYDPKTTAFKNFAVNGPL